MFRKNYIVVITVICGIALLGLVFIQFYWINAAIEQGKNELKGKINNTLFDIVQEVGKYEARMNVKSKDPNKLLNKLNQGMNTAVTYDSLTGTFYYSSQGASFSAPDQIMQELMQEMLSNGKPISLLERLPMVTLDSIIDRVLTNKGIKSKYKFGVFTEHADIVYGNTDDTEMLLNSSYQIDLFPADFFSSRFILVLEIPDERSIVIRSMWMMLGISAFFVLIIIFAFYYTIATIVKQKKLSIIKNDFINNMTHELKTPISTISLACEALSDKDIGNSDTTRIRFVSMISDENKRLGTLVENVLQSAVIERGDLKLKKENLDIHEIITSAVQNINIQVQKRNGVIHQDTKAKNTKVFGDKVHITNVIYNLLDNANKYTAGTPIIQIVTTDLVGGVMIKIKDNGIGIAKDHQDKVFEKLFRVPTGDRHDVKGFGLGLSYVKSIVENHDGEISLTSAIGKGSSFNIYLPTIKIEENE